MKKIILAFDSFKGSASSTELANHAEKAIKAQLPQCNVLTFPIADGGEGTTAAICAGLQAQHITCGAHDALINPIEVSYGITDNQQTAILEMAAASGLPQIPTELRNPMHTTTYGTGEMVADALNRGCRNFIIGLGGSATNDAGIGMMAALGVRFLDSEGNTLQPVGKNLIHIARIDESKVHPALKEATFTLACDVNNPFYGEQGAAYVYAPQKGATAAEVAALDEGLKHYAEVLLQQKNVDIAQISGAGAAGGMGGGLVAFLQATLKPGINTILDILQFDKALEGADLVFTGEGKLDAQTAMGKALGGILASARSKHVPVIALGGGIEATESLNTMGFTTVLSIQSGPISLDKAMQRNVTLTNIERTVTQLIRLIEQTKH